MSDHIKHECGIALIRLLKPLEYYQKKYGTKSYGVNKMYLMMEKQHNRGQDGAGSLRLKLMQGQVKSIFLEKGPQQNNQYKKFFQELVKESKLQTVIKTTLLFKENYF
jgi:amidophosphoribosyltransferase